LVTLKVTRRHLEVVRHAVEEQIAKVSSREAEALKRVLEAFKMLRVKTPNLKLRWNLKMPRYLDENSKKLRKSS